MRQMHLRFNHMHHTGSTGIHSPNHQKAEMITSLALFSSLIYTTDYSLNIIRL